MKELKEEGYNYGNLLRLLHIYGRINYKNKIMVHCILAFYSLRLPKLYYKDILEEKGFIYMESLLRMSGGSFVGSWTNRMLPKYKNDDEITRKFGGYKIELDKLKDKTITIKIQDYDDKKNLTDAIEIFMLFFTYDIEENEENFLSQLFEIKASSEGSSFDIAFNTNILVEHVYFNIWSFLTNLLYEDKIQKYLRKIETEMKTILKEVGSTDREPLSHEIQKWSEKYQGLALPVYNFDLFYNIMKRLVHERENLESTVKKENISYTIKQLFIRCENALKKEDDYSGEYFFNGENKAKLLTQFKECPIIKSFYECKEAEESDAFSNIMNYLIFQFIETVFGKDCKDN
jgi:hypothetical protein